jgi:serine/threonine protein kinase
LAAPANPPAAPIAPGFSSVEKCNAYKILSELGKGGMGAVFVAEQTQPIKRLVAIKVLRDVFQSPTAVARFEIERQALAMLNHPNVVSIYDGGLIAEDQALVPGALVAPLSQREGRPYLVMELLTGRRLLEYCDEEKLTITARLALFHQICLGVQHAHQHGIVHRDLKPTNILVIQQDAVPTAKLIDFGLAKSTFQRLTDRTIYTDFGTVVGTLEYMSPEQAAGSNVAVDTRSDVYSLGVILYELLTGARPFASERLRKADFPEALRIIREEDPERPSTKVSHSGAEIDRLSARRKLPPQRLIGQLAGELDWMTMKAMAKERNERYATAKDFADDVDNYLHDRPIEAGPPRALYRIKKFVKRHRGAFAAAATAMLGAVLAFVGVLHGLARTAAAEAVARREAESANAINAFLTEDILLQAVPDDSARENYESSVTLRDVLLRATEKVDARFAGQPERQVSVDAVLGKALLGLGSFSKARTHLARAEAHWLKRGVDDPQRLHALADLAALDAVEGRIGSAIARIDEVVARRAATLGPTHADTLFARFLRADMNDGRGRLDEAEKEIVEVIALLERADPRNDRQYWSCKRLLADVWRDRGDFERAHELYIEVIASMKTALAADAPQTQTAINNLAACLYFYHDSLPNKPRLAKMPANPLAAAADAMSELCTISERTLGANDYRHLTNLYNLAGYRFKLGELADAQRLSEIVLRRCRIVDYGKTELFVNVALLCCEIQLKNGDTTHMPIGLREAESAAEKLWGPTDRRTQRVKSRIKRFGNAKPHEDAAQR